MKTKIVATYGPSIEGRPVLSKIMKHVDVFRLNFSHGNEETWAEAIENISHVSRSMNREVSLLADLPGPKIRIGDLKSSIGVKKGELVTFRYGKPSEGAVPLDHDIFRYLNKKSVISIGDGYPNFRVIGLSKGNITCRALNSGALSSRKGINIMNGRVTAAPPTAEDVKLARFAKRNGFDFIGMSFVRSAQNISDLRKKIGGAYVIAKIERAEAVKHIDSIVLEADAIMVARGDLAFEIPVETLPIIQARIIRASLKFHKPVIVATQMLASMVNNPMPTRAEVNDIATAVASGADCVMLSEESAVGKYPIESVRTLATTARNAEEIALHHQDFRIGAISDSIAFAAAEIADNYRTDCIFAPTQTGSTAKKLSALRPRSGIIALSTSKKVRKMLNIYYGVRSEAIRKYNTVDGMLEQVKAIARKRGASRYIVVSGSPNHAGSTNTLKYIE
jgi:pyruvate kinase